MNRPTGCVLLCLAVTHHHVFKARHMWQVSVHLSFSWLSSSPFTDIAHLFSVHLLVDIWIFFYFFGSAAINICIQVFVQTPIIWGLPVLIHLFLTTSDHFLAEETEAQRR